MSHGILIMDHVSFIYQHRKEIMTKKKHKYFVYDVPATMRYKIYAENEVEAKQVLIEQAGYDLKGEPIFLEDDLRKAEPISKD
jgi:hypothetical protein